jgi:hypothetical protein
MRGYMKDLITLKDLKKEFMSMKKGPIYPLTVTVKEHKDKYITVTVKTTPLNANTCHDSTWPLYYALKEGGIQSSYFKGIWSETVADNELVRLLVNLIKDPKKLQKISGHTDWQQYRSILIDFLDRLWD